jgi:hypothetical protein
MKAIHAAEAIGGILKWFALVAAVAGLVAFAAGPLLSMMVSHAGERATVAGPGVLSNGVCCVEPAWHAASRIGKLVGDWLWTAAVILGVLTLLTLGVGWVLGRSDTARGVPRRR